MLWSSSKLVNNFNFKMKYCWLLGLLGRRAPDFRFSKTKGSPFFFFRAPFKKKGRIFFGPFFCPFFFSWSPFFDWRPEGRLFFWCAFFFKKKKKVVFYFRPFFFWSTFFLLRPFFALFIFFFSSALFLSNKNKGRFF